MNNLIDRRGALVRLAAVSAAALSPSALLGCSPASPASRAARSSDSDGNGQGGANEALRWKHFPAGENGFFRAPVLLTGQKEAVLIDGGFTLADGRAVSEAIAASGKTLTTIYVSQSDPDYYFGLAPIKAASPDARVIAAPATVAAIRASMGKKLEIWGPKLGANGPRTEADLVIPEADTARSITLEGETLEIVDAEGLANRRYVWSPSLRAVFGGVLVFSGLHVWTADTAKPEQRAAWMKNLDAMAARKPKTVVPGHMAVGAVLDASAIEYTKAYLVAFEEELARAVDGTALIAAMKRRYPDAGMSVALEVGAKVAKGEMKWG
ncbi:MAG: MBL fold metallo-hydrolase [Proteobacteria bacterium]|nr:MAG: MBL fold metallo-hydrolase [Pseudomonadota bacterium]